MRIINFISLFLFFSISNISGQTLVQSQNLTNTRASVPGSIASDNTLRYYRLAIPVTRSAFVEDLEEDYDMVLQFWKECEVFVNNMFAPLGFCFDVVEDRRLVREDYFPNEESENFIYTLQGNGTSYTNELIGEESYDVGMWVHHRDVAAENSGLSAEGGVYSSIAKGSGYSKTDKWVVAHELGHMFGAPHTTTGEGSLMDSGGDDFFSYPSIKKIRGMAVEKGAGSAYKAVKVDNSAPVFVNANMKDSYRIPQGACIAIPVYANDADGNILTYSAIGCSSSTVGNVVEGGAMPHFASLIPQTGNVIDYRPEFTADIFYDDFYYIQNGTDIPEKEAGKYNIAILVNDVPASTDYDNLTKNPFYSNYAVWDASVQIIGGTAFKASMSPVKESYSAGEQVKIEWGVNRNYFTADSRLRITMSADYGKTFSHVLADNVPALDGSKTVTMPNVNIGNTDVDFKTAVRSMRGGIIRVEEIGGIAYTLTTLSPDKGGGFNLTGNGSTPEPERYTVTAKASPAEGGTAGVSVGANQATVSATVTKGTQVTLRAVANAGYGFAGWYDGGKPVSYENPYTVTVTADMTYTANFASAETFPDGAYKIHWQQNGRGYLAYHSEYPDEAKLADVTLQDYSGSHFDSSKDPVDLVWYLITAQDGNRYLFHAATGKFLAASDKNADNNAKANKLSATEALPVRIEKNTAHNGHYVLMATVNSTDALLSSGCDTPSASGAPVRWWYDNGNKNFMSDGGSPLTLIPVENIEVETSIINAVNSVINNTGEQELAAGYYRFRCVGSGEYLSSEINAKNGNRLIMGGADNIFYYDRSALLSYTEGQYVGIADAGNRYDVTLSKTGAAPVSVKAIPSAGAYYISLGSLNDYGNGIRYLYGSDGEADSGTQETGLPDDDGYKWNIEKATALPVKIGKTGWTTIYAPVALEVPADVVAYYIEKKNFAGDYIILTTIADNVIPASTGAILYAKEAVGSGKVYDFEITESSSSYYTNILDGSIAKEMISSEVYILAEAGGAVGLYKAEMDIMDNKAFISGSHKAYLLAMKLENTGLSSGWRFRIEDNITEIDKIQDEEHDKELYDLTGRRIKAAARQGIYICNGKKIYYR